jgi:hypothetical protein
MVQSFLMKQSRILVLKKIQQSVQAVYGQHRLLFKKDGDIDYTEKDGTEHLYTVDELSSHLWLKMDEQLSKGTGTANLTAINVTVDDVKGFINKLPRMIGGVC